MDVLAFQQTHKNHLGLPLRDDGDLGPETQWALDFETLSPQRKAIQFEAWKHRGLIEIPPKSNNDPAGIITMCLKRCGANPGDAWCASILSFWLSVSVPVKIPGALNLVRHFPRVDRPFALDIGAFPTNEKGNGHCFLIIGVSKDGGELMTWEGNSDNAVRCCRRYRTAEMIFGRVLPETIGTCPGVIPKVLLAGGGTR